MIFVIIPHIAEKVNLLCLQKYCVAFMEVGYTVRIREGGSLHVSFLHAWWVRNSPT